MSKQWRCFHCDGVFGTIQDARQHFGTTELAEPACFIDIARYRRMEYEHHRNVQEDTDKDREMARMRGDHGHALRRAEEAGYHNCLKDLFKVVPLADFYELREINERLRKCLSRNSRAVVPDVAECDKLVRHVAAIVQFVGMEPGKLPQSEGG